MLVENNANLVSLKVENNSLKNLSEKFKEDKTLSRILKDSVEIKNSDSFITTTVRTAEDAEKLIESTKKSIFNNPKQAILAHSKLS